MSKRIVKCKSFFILLLNTSKQQGQALLDTVTKEQTHAIAEIAYNLLNISLKGSIKKKVSKRRKILQKLSNKNLQYRGKSLLIYKHSRCIYDTLINFSTQIQSLMRK